MLLLTRHNYSYGNRIFTQPLQKSEVENILKIVQKILAVNIAYFLFSNERTECIMSFV